MKVYQLQTALHDLGGNFISNVFHFQLTEAGTETGFSYAKKLINSWVTHTKLFYEECMGSDVVFDFITAKRVQSPGGPSATVVIGETCTGAAQSAASGLAADITWQCNAGTNRPAHTYIGCVPTGTFVSGFWQAPYPTVIDNFVAKMLDTLTLTGGAGDAKFGQYTRKLDQFNQATEGELKGKPTMLNKRTLPVV